MDTMKLKKCSVKLNRLSFIGVNPDDIQEQILDQRIRKCSVRVRRVNDSQQLHIRPVLTPNCGQPLRRCFIRLPRLNVVRSDISSPVASVVSGHLLSDTEELDIKNNRTNELFLAAGRR